MDFRRDLIADVKTKEETFDVSHPFHGRVDGLITELLHQCQS